MYLVKKFYYSFLLYFHLDEFKGHCLLEACRIADVSKVKKLLNSDIAKFKHPLTGDTVFVSTCVLIISIYNILNL